MTVSEMAHARGVPLIDYGREVEEEIARLMPIIDRGIAGEV